MLHYTTSARMPLLVYSSNTGRVPAAGGSCTITIPVAGEIALHERWVLSLIISMLTAVAATTVSYALQQTGSAAR